MSFNSARGYSMSRSRRFGVVMSCLVLILVLNGGLVSGTEIESGEWLVTVPEWWMQPPDREPASVLTIDSETVDSVYWMYNSGSRVDFALLLFDRTGVEGFHNPRGSHYLLEYSEDGTEHTTTYMTDDGPLFSGRFSRATAEQSGADSGAIDGLWQGQFHERFVRTVEKNPTYTFITFEDPVPVLEIDSGSYVVTGVQEGVYRVEGYGHIPDYYIIADPTDEGRMWLTTDEHGPGIEPWESYDGLAVASMRRLGD